MTTTYGYDILGRKVSERTTGAIDFAGVSHDRELTYGYDDMGRMTHWHDAVTGLQETITYDDAGNQTRVQGSGGGTSVDHFTEFDEAGRVITLRNGGSKGAISGSYTYDAAGNRATYTVGEGVTTYTYDSENRPLTAITLVSGLEHQVLTWQYDAVGNNTWFQEVKDGVVLSTVTKQFDAASANLFTRTETYKDVATETQEVSQQYDAAGRVSKTTMRTFGKSNKTYYYVYDYHGDGRERGIRAFGDASGNASFVYDSNDKLITLNQGKGDGMDRAEVSHFVYDSANQILAKYHDSGKGDARDRIEYLYAQGNPVAETGVKIEGGAFTLMDTENYALFQHYSKDFPGGSMMSYTVNSDGETLQSIANAMYRNPSQWYLIAGANGLSGGERLKAGQVLSVPSKSSSGEIDESAHKTYNENEIIGSKLPNLQAPPPPKKKCSGLLMILVVIIAVVVTIYTAGVASTFLGATGGLTGGATAVAGATASATFSAGFTALTSSAVFSVAGVAAAAIGGAAGSIASQAFAVGVGLQEKINWKSVALSAVGSGLTAGLGSTGLFTIAGSPMLSAGLSAAASSVATQGLAIALKMQDKFSWRQVAAAGVSAAVGSKLGDMFKVGAYGGGIVEKSVTASAQSITNQLIMTGKVNWRTVGVDGIIAGASFQVGEKFKGTGWQRTLANGLLGAGSAALRKENVLAGAYSGVAGSLVSQYGSRKTGMEAALYKGLIGAGTAALTKQDIAAGFIGGAAGSLVSEYVRKGAEALGVDTLAEDPRTATPDYVKREAERLGVDPLTLDSRTGTSEFLKSGLSQDDIMTQFVGAIGSGLGRTIAEWAGRDGNTAAMIGASTASKSYTEAVAYGRNDRDQAAAARLATLVVKPVELGPVAINTSALKDMSFLDAVRPPGPTPEESQAAFRDSERAYRSSTDTGAVVQKGDRLEILAGRDKVMMGRYIAGMGLKDPNALQVGQAMVANWDMTDAEAEALSDKFYVADAKVKAAAVQAKLAAQAKADAIADRAWAELTGPGTQADRDASPAYRAANVPLAMRDPYNNFAPSTFMELSRDARQRLDAGAVSTLTPIEDLYAPRRSIAGDAYRTSMRYAGDSSQSGLVRTGYAVSGLVLALPGLADDIVSSIYSAPNNMYVGARTMAQGWENDNLYQFSDGLGRFSLGLLDVAGVAGTVRGAVAKNAAADAFVANSAYARSTYGVQIGENSALNSRTGMATGIAEFDLPFSQSAQASKMLNALDRRGVTVIDDATRLPANTSAQVFRENGNLTLVYDSKSTSFVDMLHESRHVAQVQRAEASGLLGNKDIFGNSRLVGAAERGAYEYELRLGQSRGFSSEYMNYLNSQKQFYYPSSFSTKFNASPTMGGIFNAMEPGLKP